MTCIGCSNTKPVLNCISNLKIGTLSNNTEYYVYFKNSSSGKINRITATSSIFGVLSVVLDFTPLAKSQYEVWVTLSSSTDLDARQNILIDAITTTCLYVQFQRVYGANNSTITSNLQTLKLA